MLCFFIQQKYPKIIQIILTFIVPIGLCVFYPANSLFNKETYSPLMLVLIILMKSLNLVKLRLLFLLMLVNLA